MTCNQPFNWTLKEYTANEWTEVAKAEASIRAVVLANTSESDIEVSVRLSNGPTEERAVLLPTATVAAKSATVMDMNALYLGRADQLQVKASGDGLHVTASGEVR